MSELTRVTASFAIGAGGFGEGDLDVTGLNPDQIADLIWQQIAPSPSLCHQCTGEVIDPEVDELTGFCVDGVEYEMVGDHWVPWEDDKREIAREVMEDRTRDAGGLE